MFRLSMSVYIGSVQNFPIGTPLIVLLTFFVNNFIMTGEPTHTASEMVPCAPAISIIV